MRNLFQEKYYLIFFLFLSFYYFFAKYYSSDFFFVNDDFTMLELKNSNYYEAFFFTDSWWRPFKNLFYNYLNINYYLSTNFIINIKVFLHIIITFVIYLYFVFYSKNNFLFLVLSLFFLFHQSSVIAIYGLDTFGQLVCTIFGILSFIFIMSYCNFKKAKYLYFSIVLSAFSLLSKENAISFIFINSLTLIFFNVENKIFDLKKQFSKNFFPILLFFLLVIIYLFLRYYLNASWQLNSGSERYSINIIYFFKNLFQFNFSVLNPIDNTFIYLLLKNLGYQNILFLIIFILISLSYIFLCSNFSFSQNLLKYFLIFVLSGFPVFLISHTSELYTYHSVFFLCFFLLNLIMIKKKNFFNQYSILFVLIFFSCLSQYTKINNMNKNSILSKKLFDYFSEISRDENLFENLYFLENKDDFTKYSNFKLNSFENFVPRFFIRKNFNYDIIPIRENNKEFLSNGKTFKINYGDGLETIPPNILSNENFTLFYLDVYRKPMSFKQLLSYFFFEDQCVLVIKPIKTINQKICNY